MFYANLVLADHHKYEVIGRYHLYDYLYYANVVPADHFICIVVGRYHLCDKYSMQMRYRPTIADMK